MLFNATKDQHDLLRPLLDNILGESGGNWSKEGVLEHASAFIGDLVRNGQPLRVPEDVSIWVAIFVHK